MPPKWKEFESGIQEYLQGREAEEPLTYHRFYDTASAGDFLPAQPGDFLVLSRGHCILLEAKHSVVHKSLKSCFASAVSSAQIGFHRVWQRAGATTYFIFKHEPEDGQTPILELWDGKQLVMARHDGRRLSMAWRVRVGETLDDVLRGLYLNLPEQRSLLM